MNCLEREIKTLSFSNDNLDRGCLEESMEPWDKTVVNWKESGYDTGLLDRLHGGELPTENVYAQNGHTEQWQYYYNSMQTDDLMEYETGLGWDPCARITIRLPFVCFEEKILNVTDEYVEKMDRDGWIRRYPKSGDMILDIKPVVYDEESWEALKERAQSHIERYMTMENMEKAFGKYKEGAKKGDFTVRLRLSGFFWTPRFLFGVEDHLMAYYDYPELLNDISDFVVENYKKQLGMLFQILTPSLIFFEEDFSGKTGPMISVNTFNEFVTPYYKKLIPFLKGNGVSNVFMDSDGDFTMMIPSILDAGIDGMLPIDVNAGVDIVEVRRQYPTLKFFGSFNKLALIDGKEAIEAELRRLIPVIKQGGCIICTDHQAPPQTPIENYRYYVRRLRETLADLRKDTKSVTA